MNPSHVPIEELQPQHDLSLSRLILVSNREPYEHRHLKNRLIWEKTSGGLTSALDPVMRRRGGTWIAWGSGKADRDVVDQNMVVEVPPDAPTYRLRRVWLDATEVKGGYLGYSNQVLWPLCHITLDRVLYRKSFWHAYQSMNARFAEAVLDEIRHKPALVWIHDFHLALLPGLIRSSLPNQQIACFWHTPWPGPDVFRILPERRDLIESLLANDVLMFQTPSFLHAFLECVREFLSADADTDTHTVEFKGHRTRLVARPISVSYQTLSERARSASVERAMDVLRKLHVCQPEMRIGLGVDRLDYTKGLLKRFWAIDAFFEQYPQYRGKFTFIQIAVPTRGDVEAYRDYRELIRAAVEEINKRYGYVTATGDLQETRWQPIELREGRIGPDTLAAYYRMAELALVSSVYDGMNLVAKEYVACQVEEKGVLLVSQMAGAAEEMTDALVINPYDPEGVAEMMRRALEMPVEERSSRMRRMRAHLATHDIRAWADACLRDAGLLPQEDGPSIL
ncbi:MAG TPA: trehalose-6-phosphate synthase [Nitrospiraceae bacterium]|jgi:trehalose 6-phosphate synthase|nr:trehalose-6-phosphate synthase [Nitrospiraceae bacterium]